MANAQGQGSNAEVGRMRLFTLSRWRTPCIIFWGGLTHREGPIDAKTRSGLRDGVHMSCVDYIDSSVVKLLCRLLYYL